MLKFIGEKMRILLFLISTMFLAACATTKNTAYVKHIDQSIVIPRDVSLAIKFDETAPVPFHGQVNYDDLDVNHGQMTYLGNSPALFAASILAHAAVVGAAEDNKKQDQQKEADKVLEPYASAIEQFTVNDLVVSSLEKLSDDGVLFDTGLPKPGTRWIVQFNPVYFMSPDQATLVLKNAVSIFDENNPAQPVYQNLVEVVSSPPSDGEQTIAVDRLRGLSTALFADSLTVVRAELADTMEQEDRETTLHYFAGGEKVYERGQVIDQTCGRMTFRSLRGWLKSVPVIENDEAPECQTN